MEFIRLYVHWCHNLSFGLWTAPVSVSVKPALVGSAWGAWSFTWHELLAWVVAGPDLCLKAKLFPLACDLSDNVWLLCCD